MTTSLRLAIAATAMIAAAQAAEAKHLMGLTADNALVRIDSESRQAMAPVRVTGLDGRLIGIDQRPSNGMLYGVTDRGQIVTIDPATGRATQASRLNMEFQSGGRAIVDFNPVADRLRLMGMSGVNFRVNVDTGQVVRDGTVKYAAGSPLAETMPRVTAGAYTNSVAGTTATALYTIDTLQGTLNLQQPPNDGVQQPRGQVNGALPPGVAFDILADGQGGNAAFLLAGGILHGVNLETGAASVLGPVAGLPADDLIDIAAMR